MYPSSNNNDCQQPRTSFLGNYNNDTNHPKTPQEHYHVPPSSSPSFPFPSLHYSIPLEDEAIFCEFFQQQQFFYNDHNNHNTIILDQEHSTHEMTTNVESTMGECSNNNGQVATNDGDDDQYDFNAHLEPENSSPRKRPSKRDRHSKINTARGPRDRRMRLSLDVAKKLFGLQDTLGFDKASKTVDWLLTKSKAAIQELLPDQSCIFTGISNSASSTSECEVLSGTADQSLVKTRDDQATTKNKAKSSSGSSRKEKDKITKGVRRSANLHHPLAKATREKARERARERTREKRNNKLGHGQDLKFRPCLDQAILDQPLNRLGSWSPFEANQVQSIDQPDQMSSHFQFKQGFVGDNSSPMMTGNWCPSYLLNYHHSAGLIHEHQFNDFPIIDKAWESNNT